MKIGLNILFLIPHSVGGTETYARGIIDSLIKEGKENSYFLFCNKETYPTFNEKKNLTIVPLPVSGNNRLIRVLFEQLILPFYVYKYHLGLLHSLGYSCPFFLPCPSICTIFDLNWYYHPEDFNSIERMGWSFVVKNSARFCNIIITSSEASKKSLIQVFKIPKDKISVVYGGLPEMSKPKTQKSLYRLGINEKYIFTVSATYPHKNLITLLKAFKEISDKLNHYQLVVVGLSGREKEKVTNYIKRNTLENKVLLLGWVDDKDLSTLYKYAQVMVFPSFYEGFGFPVLEAFGLKTPVISSDAYSLSEVVGDAGILVAPANVNGFVKEIIRVLEDSGLRNDLSLKGYERSRIFNWKKSARKTLKIYAKIVGND